MDLLLFVNEFIIYLYSAGRVFIAVRTFSICGKRGQWDDGGGVDVAFKDALAMLCAFLSGFF